ncbi:hypothetical protein BS11774_01610 [Bacillus subtilis]|nr:hypothetical protein BSP4_02410 [Bacillus subtilis subsp. subtilis]PSL99187.1 hypothetical protein C7T97_12025 [Bacillus subtilis]QAR59311.1 hypothetical protein BS11774_01610 [Bacillus subtilis]RMD55416.1 hypothetical protein D3Z89_09230 [Bacillus subtilis]SMF00177.1 hypothetical protein SAMN02744787_1125 [Bacillus subtilis]
MKRHLICSGVFFIKSQFLLLGIRSLNMQKTFFSLSSIKKLIVIRMQLNMNGSKKISDMIQIELSLINKQKSRGQAALLFI